MVTEHELILAGPVGKEGKRKAPVSMRREGRVRAGVRSDAMGYVAPSRALFSAPCKLLDAGRSPFSKL